MDQIRTNSSFHLNEFLLEKTRSNLLLLRRRRFLRFAYRQVLIKGELSEFLFFSD